jgi:hypothetical protein
MDKMSLAQNVNHLLDWPMSENESVVGLPFACLVKHPDIAKETKAFFASSTTPSPCTVKESGAATTVGTTPGDTSGNLNRVIIQVRSFEVSKKDLSAKICQAKSTLCFIRYSCDMTAGTITNVD